MAATQVPKVVGLLFLLVGVPLTLWDAWGTSKRIAELDSTVARQKQCVEKTASLSITDEEAGSFCGCVVARSKEAGIFTRHGGYDEKALRPIVDACAEDYVQQ